MRAVMARTHRDALVIEQRRQVMRVHAIDEEREHGGLVRGFAEQAHAGRRLQRGRRVIEQVPLVCADALDPDRVYVVDRGTEADETGDVRRPGLELVRRVGEYGSIETDRL